jgi:hypothetical protein
MTGLYEEHVGPSLEAMVRERVSVERGAPGTVQLRTGESRQSAALHRMSLRKDALFARSDPRRNKAMELNNNGGINLERGRLAQLRPDTVGFGNGRVNLHLTKRVGSSLKTEEGPDMQATNFERITVNPEQIGRRPLRAGTARPGGDRAQDAGPRHDRAGDSG